eukprot:8560141-Alexandrium_andersonii.AAC.1
MRPRSCERRLHEPATSKEPAFHTGNRALETFFKALAFPCGARARCNEQRDPRRPCICVRPTEHWRQYIGDSGSARQTRPELQPVSYTHLTLPTICSV